MRVYIPSRRISAQFCAQFCARNFASITALAASWEKNLRLLIKDTHGQGWSLRQKGLCTTQVTRRWSDNSRSSATVRIPWKRSSGPKLLALVERSDFLGTRLALLDEIIEASIRCKQHSNAVGALKLQAQLTRLLEGS